MADLTASIFAGLQALYAADTASGGLFESTGGVPAEAGVAVVRHFFRSGDPNFAGDRAHTWAYIVVEIVPVEDRAFAERHDQVTVRLRLRTNRNVNTSDFTTQNAIANRMFTVYDGVQMTTQGGYVFSILDLQRTYQGPTTDNELELVMEFVVRQPADLFGRQATMTYAGTEIDETLLKGYVVELGTRREPVDVRLWHDTDARFTFDVLSGQIRMQFWVDAATTAAPPIPTGTAASLVIGPNSGNSYTVSAAVTGHQYMARTNGGTQQLVYELIQTLAKTDAEGASSITVA